jgi:hypothetical protein
MLFSLTYENDFISSKLKRKPRESKGQVEKGEGIRGDRISF